MPALLPFPTECCCDDSLPGGGGGGGGLPIPGPPGHDGAPGVDGEDGKNAFTTLAAGFTQPVVGGTVAVTVVDGTFVNVGQYLHIQGGGVYLVTAKTDATHITIQNVGGTGSLTPGNPVPVGAQVSPAGEPGTGSTGPAGPPGVPGPPGLSGQFLLLLNRAALKVMPTPVVGTHPLLVFLQQPEPGVNTSYTSVFGSAAVADDENIIEPDDHLCRYFWYDL